MSTTPTIAPSPPLVGRLVRDIVTVQGPDAVAYLQGQLSQDVAGLAVGTSAPSFVLAPQGKVDGWGRVHRTADDAFEIDVDPGAGEAWDARLRRFLLRTNAEISVEASVVGLAVRGIEVEGALAPVAPWLVGGDLLRTAEGAGSLPSEAQAASPDALDALRIRAGIPAWGFELDGDTIPATVGQWVIDASVSFTKGCYTGQELVARIDSRGGHVPRRLVGVEVEGPAPAPGTPLLIDGDEMATITSSAPDGTGSVALAFLPRSASIEEQDLPATVGLATAVLRPLPLVP